MCMNGKTMPKDKEIKVLKNANYVVTLRIDNVQEHYENGSNCFCRPLIL